MSENDQGPGPEGNEWISASVSDNQQIEEANNAATPGNRGNVFALLIGINQYASPLIPNLRGAVSDARAVKAFLIEEIGVQGDHIQELHNTQATRENIEAAILGFAEDQRIYKNDSILIYYAGHGSEVLNPQPIALTSKVQMLIPHNFVEEAADSDTAQSILDFNFSEWLAKLARIKGDNIVSPWVFDSESDEVFDT
jgi:uncharacterized caspase-like protein